MSFDVPSDAYARFMGRYAEPLADAFLAFAGVGAGDRVLDVGCGPGALTAQLLSAGAEVAAIDPSPPFIDAIRARFPAIDAREGVAEQLPYDAASFDAALAQLVVHFMSDPVGGLRQMARVTRRDGVIAACVWDGPTGALAPFWDAVHVIDPEAQDEALLSGAYKGHLTELFEAAGLHDVEEQSISVDVAHPTFEEWWEPYTFGVGPAGDYVQRLDDAGRARLESSARERLGSGPFTVTATAWAARAVVSGGVKDVYRDYLDCLNERRWDDLERFVADDVIYNGKSLGLSGYRALLESDTHAVPDLRFTAELLLADESVVACRLFFRCTPRHEFLGFQPTGEQVSFAEHVFYRFRDGRIAEVWSLIDKEAVRAQVD